MPLFQFKTTEEDWVKICRNMRKKFRAIILCEGDDDIKRVKELVRKMNITFRVNVGIAECEGYPTIREIASYTASIARLSRTPKKIIIIVDADTYSAEQRVHAIRDSLIAHEINVTNLEPISGSIYSLQWERITILVKVVGLTTLPFPSHMMEDYLVRLLVMTGQIQENQLDGFENAKDFLEQNNIQTEIIILQAENLMVQQAFENILNLLNLI